MAEALYLQSDDTVDYTATGTVAAGEIIRLADGRAGVIKTAGVSGDKLAVYVCGQFRVYCAAATTFAAGDPVVWDTSASAAVAGMGALTDFFVGTALVASDSSTAYVDVDLNNVASLNMFVETATAAAPALKPYGTSILDSTSNAVDATLAAGIFVGSTKKIVMQQASNSSTVTIANHVTSDPEVATFDAVDEYLLLQWTGTEWATIHATATFV